jgi:glycosyltransferase involved in cell wall biosynthesis
LKGIQILAEAMPQIWQAIPEARFTFVPASMGKGGGSPTDSYREILGSLLDDYRVQVGAPVSRKELPELYRSATLCVVPSLWEGFGYVCAEAMACGLPVIASRVGGLQEIVVEGQSGVLVKPGDAPELAKAVIELLRDGDRRRSLGLVARKRIVEQFSSAAIATRMANFYQEVVQEAAN